MRTVGVLSYGEAGNYFSIFKALRAVGATPVLVDEYNAADCSHLVIPGVGSFNDVMLHLRQSSADELVRDFAAKKPVLGICLGMQILAALGFEDGRSEGVGIFSGEVCKMETDGVLPHMGFSPVQLLQACPLFNGLSASDRFYFMHSYELRNYPDVVGLTEYCGHQFVSAIQKNNIFGVQFHPEKSRQAGLSILQNFLEV